MTQDDTKDRAAKHLANEIAVRCRYWLGREDTAQRAIDLIAFDLKPEEFESDLHYLLAVCEAAGA